MAYTVRTEEILRPASLLSLRVRPVRVVQAPCRAKNFLLTDSATSSGENSGSFKADDRGVLDVHRLRITQKMPELSRFKACMPLSIEGIIIPVNKDSTRDADSNIHSADSNPDTKKDLEISGGYTV